MQSILIVGAGGLGKELLTYLREIEKSGVGIEVAGFLDQNTEAMASRPDAPILGTDDDFNFKPDHRVVIALGNPGNRKVVAERIKARGASLFSLIHPLAYIAQSAQLYPGCIIAPFAFVGADSVIGENAFINAYALVGHDCNVGAHSVLSPYATLNAEVSTEEEVFLGTHATVLFGRNVGRGAKIAAGSVLYGDLPERQTALGNPAKALGFQKTKS